MKTITLSDAKTAASDSSYVTTDDIGRLAIMHTDDDGVVALVDIAADGETPEQAIAAYLVRVCEDDDGSVTVARIVAG